MPVRVDIRPIVLALMLGLPAGQSAAQTGDLATLTEQAEAGDADAQSTLAIAYYEGAGVAQSYAESASWAEKAALQGNAVAQNLLGRYAYAGLGVPRDQEVALRWLRAAAEQDGNPLHLYDLGAALETGADGSSDPEGAARAYAAAANQGNLDAAVSLGVLLQEGRGIEQDYTRALGLYEAAAAGGNVRALNNLGLLYVRGDGVTQDYVRAAQLFSEAAEKGLKPAMRNLGVMFENGFGVPLDEARAASLYRAAGGEGDTDPATNAGGLIYDARLLPPTDDGTLLTQQAAAGDPVAQFQLGWLIITSSAPTHAQKAEAAGLFGAAANAGYAPAMANLGILYFQGVGVAQDYMLGQMWLTLAAQAGLPSAREAISFYAVLPTAAQINEAQALAQARLTQP